MKNQSATLGDTPSNVLILCNGKAVNGSELIGSLRAERREALRLARAQVWEQTLVSFEDQMAKRVRD